MRPARKSSAPVDRRAFLKQTGRSVLLAGAAVAAACEVSGSDDAARREFFSYDFAGSGDGWSEQWLNVRYAGHWARRDGEGIVRVGPAPGRAVDQEALQTEYMAQPLVVPLEEVSDAAISVSASVEGSAEAGVVARWDHDRAYALVVRDAEILLIRYAIGDSSILKRRPLPSEPRWWQLTLAVEGDRIRGRATGGGTSESLSATDPDPFGAGTVGLVVNPTSGDEGGAARFRSFRATSTEQPVAPGPRFVYGFVGGVIADEEGTRARLTARTVYPRPIGFEVARDEAFSEALVLEPREPEGRWGSVHAWAEGLDDGGEHFWRPFTSVGGRRVVGRPARFRTPARGRAVRFAFGSCTSGRTTNYTSFATAASFDPEFYLHAGDWGYPSLTALAHSPDHFQHRWTRLLRTSGVDALIRRSPLMFWQDDHDYQADNGWAKTCEPYTVWSFDELHANPSDEYFDLRWGDLHVWCLDCRLYASNPAAPDDESKTRLGEKQKRWLEDGMASSDAPVRIVAAPMVFRNKVQDDPGWHNDYTTERDELLAFFASLDATVFILSGDSHGHRLVHHFEFGELYEVVASGTDFPETSHWGQGNNDPQHTIHNIVDRTGFALVDLDPPGEARKVTIRSIATKSGETMFEKSLPVSG